MALLSQRDFAKLVGVSKSTVAKWCSQKFLPIKNGKINSKSAIKVLNKMGKLSVPTQAPTYGKVPTGGQESEPDDLDGEIDEESESSAVDYWTEKAKHERSKRLLSDLEYARQSGQVVTLNDVDIALSKLVTAVRQRLLSAPSKGAQEAAHQPPGVVQKVYTEIIHEALQEFENYDPVLGVNTTSSAESEQPVSKKRKKTKAAAKSNG